MYLCTYVITKIWHTCATCKDLRIISHNHPYLQNMGRDVYTLRLFMLMYQKAWHPHWACTFTIRLKYPWTYNHLKHTRVEVFYKFLYECWSPLWFQSTKGEVRNCWHSEKYERYIHVYFELIQGCIQYKECIHVHRTTRWRLTEL